MSFFSILPFKMFLFFFLVFFKDFPRFFECSPAFLRIARVRERNPCFCGGFILAFVRGCPCFCPEKRRGRSRNGREIQKGGCLKLVGLGNFCVFLSIPGHVRCHNHTVPKGPFHTKNTTTIAKIVNHYTVVFLLRPPNLLRRGSFSERKNGCNSQENGVHTRCAAIVNHPLY